MVFDNQCLKNGRISRPNEHTRVRSTDVDSRSPHAPPRGDRFFVNVGLSDLADVGVCDVTALLRDDGFEVRLVRRCPGRRMRVIRYGPPEWIAVLVMEETRRHVQASWLTRMLAPSP